MSRPEVGNGLFSSGDLEANASFAVRGPWFRCMDGLERWLGGLHPETAEQMRKRVVRLELHHDGDGDGGGGQANFIYKAGWACC